MENQRDTISIFDTKKIGDDDLDNIVGGVNAESAPQHKKGDIVHIVINQTPPAINITKVITVQGTIVSDPYQNFLGAWCYDVLIHAQDAFYDGYDPFVETTMTHVSDGVIAGAARYMAEHGIKF